jgi:hypothetical protein
LCTKKTNLLLQTPQNLPKTMKKLIPFLAILIIATNCKKKAVVPPPPASYQPLTTGSVWNYSTQAYLPTASTGAYTITCIGKDTVSNGKTFKTFTNSRGDNEYYNITSKDYYQIGSIGSVNQRLELLYLKEATAGTTWSENKTVTLPGIPTPVTIPFNYTVVATDISYTVGTKTFDKVTHIKITLGTTTVSGFPITPTSDFNYYYARGVGRIYARTKLAISVPVAGININNDDEVKLASYTIL